MLVHVLLDPGVCVPLLAVAFVAANMEVRVRKESRHFAYKAIEKLVRTFTRGVHRGVEYAPFSLDNIWAFTACEIGIPDEPGGGVTGHIELRNHADAAVSSE